MLNNKKLINYLIVRENNVNSYLIFIYKGTIDSRKKLFKAVAFQTLLAWILATIVYQIGSRIENGTLNIGDILVIVGLLGIVIIALSTKFKDKNKECSGCPYCDSCKK